LQLHETDHHAFRRFVKSAKSVHVPLPESNPRPSVSRGTQNTAANRSHFGSAKKIIFQAAGWSKQRQFPA
jgi:hypothetical protein